MTQIALVASKVTADLHADGPLLIAAFDALAIDAEIVSWGTGPDWRHFDGVLIRNAWDYVFDRRAFLDWATQVSSCTRLANPLEVLEWNTDKRYLRDLEARGVPTVPTMWVECGEPTPSHSWGDFVVKPSVSAGARLSARYQHGGDPDDHIRLIHATGAAAMIQPYLPSVDRAGETGIYVFGDEISHAIAKGPVLHPGKPPSTDFLGATLQSVSPAEVDPQLAGFARRVIDAAPPLLYARVDCAPGADGEPVLLELEAAEPYLFLEHAASGAACFARAVKCWLEDAQPVSR